MIDLLLQISPGDAIDLTTKVSPTTMFGYGFAVLCLSILAYINYKRATSAEDTNREQARQMLDFGMKMSGQLASNQQLMNMLQKHPEDTTMILRVVEENSLKLERIREEILNPNRIK